MQNHQYDRKRPLTTHNKKVIEHIVLKKIT